MVFSPQLVLVHAFKDFTTISKIVVVLSTLLTTYMHKYVINKNLGWRTMTCSNNNLNCKTLTMINKNLSWRIVVVQVIRNKVTKH